jgi:hypothetical protein
LVMASLKEFVDSSDVGTWTMSILPLTVSVN